MEKKNKIKLILSYLFAGIGWGSFMFVINAVINAITIDTADLNDVERVIGFFDNIPTYTIGYFAVGIGFFGTAIIYEIERLSFGLKLIIHMVIGIGVLLIVGFSFSWFSFENPVNIIGNIIFSAAMVFIGWTVAYIQNKKEVERINKVLAEKNHRKPLDTD